MLFFVLVLNGSIRKKSVKISLNSSKAIIMHLFDEIVKIGTCSRIMIPMTMANMSNSTTVSFRYLAMLFKAVIYILAVYLEETVPLTNTLW